MGLIRAGVLASAAIMVVWPACAAQWDITPSAAVEESFTDNLGLRRDAEDRNSDFVSTITPGISIRGSGARVNLNADYTYSHLFHLHASEQNGGRNNLSANASAEVWEKSVFIDGAASISPQIANTQSAVSQSTANVGVNAVETTTWSLAPRFLHHFGTWAETTSILSHTATSTKQEDVNSISGATSGTLTGAPVIRDSAVDTASFEMRSGRRFTQLLWSTTAYSTRSSTDTAPHHSDKLARADLTYVVNRKISINGGGGWQIITDDALAESPNGPIWSIGTTYRPGPRVTLQVAYNSQFDSRFFTYSGSYIVSPRTTISFNHSENVTTTNQILAQRLPVFDPLTGTFLDPVTGLPIDPLANPQGLQSDTLRQKTWNATFSSRSGRNTYSLNLNRTESEVERTGQVTTQTGVVLTYSRALSRRLNGNISANYRISDTTEGLGSAASPLPGVTATTAAGSSTSILFSGNLAYTLTPETSVNFRVNYSEFDAGSEALSSHEKSAAVSLRRTF
jgi:uncharacterized protein (PEP-CTERM system associated)